MKKAAPTETLPTGTTSGTPQVLLGHHLKQLKLPTILREYDKVARECARDGVDHPRYLLRLVELELIDRERRLVERRIKQARFPAVKSLDSFDFKAIPSLNKMLVLELARCEFVLRRENVIALGNSGTGKTHIALALGLAACQTSIRQVEATELMIGQNNFSTMFAKALLAATPDGQLVDPRKRKPTRGNPVTSEQIARMERELAGLQSQIKSVEESYGVDNLHLTVAKGYISKLLSNPRIVRWLELSRQEYLNEFQSIAEINSVGG